MSFFLTHGAEALHLCRGLAMGGCKDNYSMF